MTEDSLALFDKTLEELESLHHRALESERPGFLALVANLKAEIARLKVLYEGVCAQDEQGELTAEVGSLLEKRNGMYFLRKKIKSYGTDKPFCVRCLGENGLLMVLTGPEVVQYGGKVKEGRWRCPFCKDQYRVRWVP